MILLICATDWCANICTLIAGSMSALVALVIWKQQKRLQKDQARFERHSQVVRIKNLLVDIQFKADNFVFDLNGILKSLTEYNKNFLYQSIAQKYDQLGGLHNELLREKRLAMVLNSNQECLDRLKDLDVMVKYMLHLLLTTSYTMQNENVSSVTKKYQYVANLLDAANHPDDERIFFKVILETINVSSPNSYITAYTFHEFLGARHLVFHDSEKSIYSLIDKIVEDN